MEIELDNWMMRIRRRSVSQVKLKLRSHQIGLPTFVSNAEEESDCERIKKLESS